MSVDDRDKKSDRDSSRSPSERESIKDALQSDTDEPLPPAAEVIANRDAQSPHPVTPQGRRRRFLNRRNLVIATIAAAAGVVALILLILIVYRLGYVDRYVAGQIKDTFAKYGICAQSQHFATPIPPQSVEMLIGDLYGIPA